MIHFERTFDYDLVRNIITHPAIYSHVCDDGCPTADKFQPITSDSIWYVLVKDDTELLGMFTFIPQNCATVEVHTTLFPISWGKRSHLAAKLVADWVWKNTPFVRIVTNVPSFNRIALRFAQLADMKQFGINEKSYRKDGELFDQIMLGMSKPCQ